MEIATIAQKVEQLARNEKVACSIHASDSTIRPCPSCETGTIRGNERKCAVCSSEDSRKALEESLNVANRKVFRFENYEKAFKRMAGL